MNVKKIKIFCTKSFLINALFGISSILAFTSLFTIVKEINFIISLLLLSTLLIASNSFNNVGCIIFGIISLVFSFNNSGYFLVGVWPTLGLLLRRNKNIHVDFTSGPFLTSIYALITFIVLFFPEEFTTHEFSGRNYISVLIVYHIIFDLLFCRKKISFAYLIPILICLLGIGNRSSIFLLLVYFDRVIKNTFAILLVSLLGIFALIKFHSLINQLGSMGLYYERSYDETRPEYIRVFFNYFPQILFQKTLNIDIPQTVSGAYDFHNSFLTILWRDKISGLIKMFLWFITLRWNTFFIYLGVSLRACCDTFFLGNIFDIITFFYVGNQLCKKEKTSHL